MVGAYADERVVGRDIVDPVGDRLANRVTRKIMNVDEFRFILWLPFSSGVLEVADKFLLLGIDGDEWNAALETVRCLRVDVLELRVPI